MPESGFERVRGSGPEQAARPLVGTAEAGGVIDPDVLWSCTTCGACVEQCPVDIEHVDHIVDMRRYQVMIESEFPSELGVLFRNLENKGNPWGQNARNRLDWTKELAFEVPVCDGELPREVEYLFWIGCAGRSTTARRRPCRRPPSCCTAPASNFVVLGPEETCTGDPARRSGNEFLFQMLAQQNVEVLNTVFEGREPAPARSSPPARTASTPSAASTRSWTGTTRWCTTPSCSTRWSARASWCRSPRRTASST